MTGGTIIILGSVGDNFAAGMTGGMAFVYDVDKEFENKVNPDSVVWQNVETDYWKKFLKDLIFNHFNEISKLLLIFSSLNEISIVLMIFDHFNEDS